MPNDGAHFQNQNIVFYHHPCLDGSVSAWCAHKKLGDTAQFIGADHGHYESLQSQIEKYVDQNCTVYFLDFVPPRDVIEKALVAKDVIIIDHHWTSYQELEGFAAPALKKVFDMERSGAGLAWDYFMEGQKRPVFIDLVEAIDLRKEHSLATTDLFFEVAAYLDSFDLSVYQDAFELFETLQHHNLEEFAEQGRSNRNKALEKIDQTLDHIEYVRLEGAVPHHIEKIPFVEANIYDLGREFSPKLLERAKLGSKVGIIWFEYKPDFYRLNIRTDGKIAATEIAQYLKDLYGFNGGGHDHSAVVRLQKGQFKEFYHAISKA